jgi:hypothetical protein
VPDVAEAARRAVPMSEHQRRRAHTRSRARRTRQRNCGLPST